MSHVLMKSRRAFSLVELIVVVGILGVLTAVLIGALSGSTDSAQAAKCLANMRTLASAVQSYGLETEYFPVAGSTQYFVFDRSLGKRRGQSRMKYYENKGWVSWFSEGRYPSESKSGGCPSVSMYASGNESQGPTDEGLYAITNGAVWKYTSGSRSVYTCPVHKKLYPSARWSYLMNAYFGWDATSGNYTYQDLQGRCPYGSLARPDRILLFSEVPFLGEAPGEWIPAPGMTGTDTDGILQYEGCSKSPYVAGKDRQDGSEYIGFNHKIKRDWFAHVVFADGHVEKIKAPKEASESALKELTTWLCTGKDFSFNGRDYRELTK